MAQLLCPWCNEATTVRRSHMRWYDLPLFLIGKKPYRCRTCNRRFYFR